MKILHFSDTHLGFSQFNALNEKNVNQREADFYDAFCQVIDEICKIKPNFIIHCGDFFHKIRPNNRAIAFALKQLKRVDELQIPFIMIAGNHSTPKIEQSTCIFEIFSGFKNIYTVYNQAYEKISFKNINFHCIPHINSEDKFLQEIELCQTQFTQDKNTKNILLLHASASKSYLALEFGERIFPIQKVEFLKNFDYVAFGHWHKFTQIYKNAFYSGSLERTSLNDKSNEKGFILLDLKDELKVEFIKIKIREFLNFEIDFNQLENFLENINEKEVAFKIINLTIKNISFLEDIDLDLNKIRAVFKSALFLNIKKEVLQAKIFTQNIEVFDLQDRFFEFLNENIQNSDENTRLSQKAKKLFSLEEI